MACECAGVTNPDGTPAGGGGCCGLQGGGSVPFGTAIVGRVRNTDVGGSAFELPIFTQITQSAVTVGSQQRIYIAFVSIVCEDAGTVHLFQGTSTGDGEINSIIGGMVSDFGGIIANMPWIPLDLGQKLYIQLPATGSVDVSVYGRIVSVQSVSTV